jgi:hypothetical protein
MSQTKRLGQLNAAESWLNNYRYLVNADFKAYDFESLRTALLNHVQTNYPEDFNDFINSSEYVALIDMMAFIGQNLAFRSDLNLRETFLETAEVRGNVLSIARQLGYKPYRNSGASSFLRISALSTTQNIYDSKGTNISGRTIVWGDPLNADFNEQITLILNETFSKSNPVGRPISSITESGVVRQLYQVAQPTSRTMVETFTLSARNNTNYSCELVPINIDLDSQLAIESTPNPYSYLTALFNNDGTGYSNTSNGWFFMFKQGTLKFEDYVLDTSVENRVIDLAGENINDSDVWVQSIDATGRILYNWEQVPSTVGKNIAFNATDKDTRKIYEVITRENDSVSLKFGDGTFADIPMGNIRVWYRESANENTTFNPVDVSGLQIAIRYVDSTDTEQDLLCTLQLAAPTSSTASESLEQIKSRASRSAASQERMITASDYNTYPEGKVGGIDKIKAVNRSHAGQSIYSVTQDPTGTYRPVITFADDAFVYVTETTSETSISSMLSDIEVFSSIENLLTNSDLHQLYYKKFKEIVPIAITKWVTVEARNQATNGYFTTIDNVGPPLRIGRGTPDLKYRTIKKNSLIKLKEEGGTIKWARLLDVYREGFGLVDNDGNNTGRRANGQGAVFLNNLITNSDVVAWIPSLRSVFLPTEQTEILRELEAKRSFGLRYDHEFDRWRIVRQDNVDTVSTYSTLYSGDKTNQARDASWLVRAEFSANTETWTTTMRKDQTVLGSANQITFHNQRFGKSVDFTTRRVIKDAVKFLKQNEGIAKEYKLDITDYFKLDDGRYDPKRVLVLMPGLSENLVPDDPTVIDSLLAANTILLEKVEFSDSPGQYTLTPTVTYLPTTIGPLSGRSGLKIQHDHVPLRDNRVDPTTTNIIDMFVLTTEYNSAFRSWVASGARDGFAPRPPTSYNLEQLMTVIMDYKSVSDSIIFHPVKYKVIFGKGSDIRNKVVIRVTKSEGTRISDSEISSRVIQSIDEYFNVTNWDFGESFFFTDMASWVHKQLGGIISSIALVPRQRGLTATDLFQIRCEDNELLISSATVKDVEIITSSMSITSI